MERVLCAVDGGEVREGVEAKDSSGNGQELDQSAFIK
jgi:hypothetical protein